MNSSAQEPDFTRAKFTAVISDLHLCEAEPVHPKFPLWKKYKTREFFFDDVFSDFLDHLIEKSGGETMELVLNGDIFDFDSVTQLPDAPPYRVSFLEKYRGLHPQEEKSYFKIKKILDDHHEWIAALRGFVQKGHRVIFVVGNHDLELHFPQVQQEILRQLDLSEDLLLQVRFCDWFYISNQDTLIEHGNQYDPYCLCQDPINPFIRKFNRVELRVPFGNLATRYLVNGMGYFNPHVDDNFIMSARQYFLFFFKYMVRSQPLLLWTWFWGSLAIFGQAIGDRFRPPIRDPLMVETKSEQIARRSNATPGVVRQLRTLAVPSAANQPWLLARELWLDRALILIFAAYLVFNLHVFLNQLFDISVWWAVVPTLIFFPFFLFYSGMVKSNVSQYKEPSESIIMNSSWITKTQRIVYGHTHLARHEFIGGVEHLNSGCWSPAFLDVECTKSIDQKTFVWIDGSAEGPRQSEVRQFQQKKSKALFRRGKLSLEESVESPPEPQEV